MTETTQPRVHHEVNYWSDNGLPGDDLRSMCRELEKEGWMLTGMVDAPGGYYVAVFVGVEAVFPPAQELTTEPSEIVLEADDDAG